MKKIEKDKLYEIIEDFRIEIESAKDEVSPPKEVVIDFRDDAVEKRPRKVYKVPINLLRYRKNNGRIASDVISFETYYSILDEDTKVGQKKIRSFLEKKDPEMTSVLKNQIMRYGQREAATITCDGFLINGNRRKMVLEQLFDETDGDKKYAFMRVVILPGPTDKGGPPTKLEIEEIENRYQLQKEGKSEYTGFDRALSMRRKIEMNMSLENQLRDDPEYSNLPTPDFKKVVKKITKEFILPLKCVDRYLKYFDRTGLYDSVSSGPGDPEGRWQAFIDYSNFYSGKLKNKAQRLNLKVEEDEIPTIEDVVFKIIRKRALSDIGKVHIVMRNLGKYIASDDARKELYKIAELVPNKLPKEERFDEDGEPYKPRALDELWGSKYQEHLFRQISIAKEIIEREKSEKVPLDLLEDCLKKLNHNNMIIENIDKDDIPRSMELCDAISTRAVELSGNLDHLRMENQKRSKAKKEK